MEEIYEQLTICIEKGKVNKNAPYPPDMKGQDGASELTQQAIAAGHPAREILYSALMPGMQRIGKRFGEGKAYIPDLLISAKAMNAAMEHLKPFFESGDIAYKGRAVLGTVSGDLHDIGKNIVAMVLKGEGWDVIDLGVDTEPAEFVKAVEKNQDCIVGLSALLTTTMVNMEETTRRIKERFPRTHVYIGGAPLSEEFNLKIGADGYFPDPHSFARFLNEKQKAD